MDTILLVFYLTYKGVASAKEYAMLDNKQCVHYAKVLKSRVKVGKVHVFCNRRKI